MARQATSKTLNLDERLAVPAPLSSLRLDAENPRFGGVGGAARTQEDVLTHSVGNDGELIRCPTIQDAIGDMPLWPEGEYDEQKFHWYYLSRNRYRGWSEQARTVVAKGRHTSLHPISPKLRRIHTDKWVFEHEGPARRLSYRETARLQGFQKDFLFPETAGLDLKYRVIGNAVPPPLFEAVAKVLPNIW